MRTTATMVLWAVRLLALTLVTLGVLFWSGRALQLVPLHMQLGMSLVLGLWIIAALAAFARVGVGPVALAFAWGPFVIWLGLTQQRLLVGDWHWVIRVLHPIAGMAAVGMAENLVKRLPYGRREQLVHHRRHEPREQGG